MACNFGWDWGPDLVTAGIWRPVTLHRWSTARLGDVLPHVTVGGSTGQVRICADVVGAHGRQGDCRIIATVAPADAPPVAGQPQHVTADVVASGSGQDVLELEVPDALLWWPRGYGDQHLYELTVVLLGPDGGELDRWEHRIGFRTITIDTAPDGWRRAVPRAGQRPAGLRQGRQLDPRRLLPGPGRPRRATRGGSPRPPTAGVNLLRVWGGGHLREPATSTTLCDELGLLVWQDFLFACAAYAEEEPLRSEVRGRGARERRPGWRRTRAWSLWNGNNENLWGHEDWDWADAARRPHLGRRLLPATCCPAIVAELDPTRPYCAGQPMVLGSGASHPNDPRPRHHAHLGRVEPARLPRYRDYRPRFVAEFGCQGPPAWSTLRRARPDDPLHPDSPGDAQSPEGRPTATASSPAASRRTCRCPADIEDWHWAMQLQPGPGGALRASSTSGRWTPHCTGSVMWQLNDCWPVTSWAAVDGDGRRKPLWHALRRALRAAPGDRAATRRWPGGGRLQRHRPAMAGVPPSAPAPTGWRCARRVGGRGRGRAPFRRGGHSSGRAEPT